MCMLHRPAPTLLTTVSSVHVDRPHQLHTRLRARIKEGITPGARPLHRPAHPLVLQQQSVPGKGLSRATRHAAKWRARRSARRRRAPDQARAQQRGAHHELVAHVVEVLVDARGGRLVLHADLHLALVQRLARLHDPGHARPPARRS